MEKEIQQLNSESQSQNYELSKIARTELETIDKISSNLLIVKQETEELETKTDISSTDLHKIKEAFLYQNLTNP